MRFKIKVCGKPVRLTHAVEPRWREHLFGPFGFRFQLNIKVRRRAGWGGGGIAEGGRTERGNASGQSRSQQIGPSHLDTPAPPFPSQNLSTDVDEPSLFERFSRYGEVYQARVDDDDFGRRSGIVSPGAVLTGLGAPLAARPLLRPCREAPLASGARTMHGNDRAPRRPRRAPPPLCAAHRSSSWTRPRCRRRCAPRTGRCSPAAAWW
jgi:hypothetical protein